MLNKKILIISLVVLPIFVLAGLAIYLFNQKQAGITPSAGEKEETLAEKQLKELEKSKEFPLGKENYCPRCYFENDKVVLREDCPHTNNPHA